MKNNMLQYILLVLGCTVVLMRSYALEDAGGIQLDYAIDYETLSLFHVDSVIPLQHYLTNRSDNIVQLRIADSVIPIYTLQKTDGTSLEYHNIIGLPLPTSDDNNTATIDDTNAVTIDDTDEAISAQNTQQSVELATDDSYVFTDTLNLKDIEGITSGSYYMTATVTVRTVNNDNLTYHTFQSDQLRLDIRSDKVKQRTSADFDVDSVAAGSTTVTIDNDSISSGETNSSETSSSENFFGGANISYPHSVVESMLTSLVATDIEKFYSFFDIERLYRIDPSNNQRFIQASDIERELLLEQFLIVLHNRPTFINGFLTPVRFEIHNTTYNRSNAKVDVSMFFISNNQELTTTTSILLELTDAQWIAIDYIALPER